ncbi:RNA polymerase sigma factor [Dictyobacter aurantiacus]|uniref:RNA polymerase sigma factor n=1 Tax=Dictyobacter aurantiacus TaxID=1936993 RepID=A0A401ZIN4_9CHLR|nr:sigma-70 family RNA polymerase sigma factor [Dictyobacter aurantiacus]GCE06703.1 RNA polymerase sigma factor [Dictyobacter aurantiacus]
MEQQVSDSDGELALIERVTHGDAEAFRYLVVLYEGRLIAYLTQMLGGDKENACDIAQETFIAVYQTLPHWKPPANAGAEASGHAGYGAGLLAPWLYRIATNRALSLLRKQEVRRRMHGPAVNRSENRETPFEQGARQSSFEDSSIARELLRAALSTLDEDDAACLVLHYVSGERYGEIAARLGMSSEAVRKRVSRALIALRKAYRLLDTEVC